jgi:hypothetical protein
MCLLGSIENSDGSDKELKESAGLGSRLSKLSFFIGRSLFWYFSQRVAFLGIRSDVGGNGFFDISCWLVGIFKVEISDFGGVLEEE